MPNSTRPASNTGQAKRYATGQDMGTTTLSDLRNIVLIVERTASQKAQKRKIAFARATRRPMPVKIVATFKPMITIE